jgi:hypothetical protein
MRTTNSISYFGGMMNTAHSHWQVNPDTDNDQTYAILSQDPVWNSFALDDLEKDVTHGNHLKLIIILKASTSSNGETIDYFRYTSIEEFVRARS